MILFSFAERGYTVLINPIARKKDRLLNPVIYLAAIILVSVLLYGSYTLASWSTTDSDGMSGDQFPCGIARPCEYDVTINGTSYSILYHLQGEPSGDPEGIKLLSITPNSELKALSVQIESNQSGVFRIDLPWSAVRAIGLDTDSDFIVLVDGEERPRSIATDTRTLILGVEFESGNHEILIGDARIIPEFSPLIIGAGIIGMFGAVIAATRLVRFK